MIIKKYLVKNMNEAMTRIRYELGKDAIIISQRKVKKPGIKGFFGPQLIEVTAALENEKKKEKAEEVQVEASIKESVESIKKIMNKENVQEKKTEDDSLRKEVYEMKGLLSEILRNTNGEDKEDALLELVSNLDINSKYINEFREVWDSSDEKEEAFKKYVSKDIDIYNGDLSGRIVLVGPTGVGKTTTIAKLAGKFSLLENKKVGLITVDTYRIGAVEQLKTYAEIMDIPFKVVLTIKEMEEAIEEMSHLDVVLIDTTGRSSKNSMQISELRAFVQKANPDHTIMVVSSITKNRDIEVILKGYEKLNYDKVIVTKLDETSTYGVVHTIVKESKKPIAFITTGQGVPADIKVPTREAVVNLILGEEAI